MNLTDNMPKSLQLLSIDSILKQFYEKKISLSQLEKYLNSSTYEAVLNLILDNDFKQWKYNLYSSLVKIESRRWTDVYIHYNKYYDEYGMRDWYEDIEIKLDEDTDSEPEYDEEDDLEIYNNVKYIKQYKHIHYAHYIKLAREWIGDDHDDYNDDQHEEDFDY